MTPLDDPRRVGDQYTFVALDPETKIVPAYRVGKRDLPTAAAFITDLSKRLANRVQLTSDALSAYLEATERAFKWLNFTKLSPSGAGATARRTLSVRSVPSSSGSQTPTTFRRA